MSSVLLAIESCKIQIEDKIKLDLLLLLVVGFFVGFFGFIVYGVFCFVLVVSLLLLFGGFLWMWLFWGFLVLFCCCFCGVFWFFWGVVIFNSIS